MVQHPGEGEGLAVGCKNSAVLKMTNSRGDSSINQTAYMRVVRKEAAVFD